MKPHQPDFNLTQLVTTVGGENPTFGVNLFMVNKCILSATEMFSNRCLSEMKCMVHRILANHFRPIFFEHHKWILSVWMCFCDQSFPQHKPLTMEIHCNWQEHKLTSATALLGTKFPILATTLQACGEKTFTSWTSPHCCKREQKWCQVLVILRTTTVSRPRSYRLFSVCGHNFPLTCEYISKPFVQRCQEREIIILK